MTLGEKIKFLRKQKNITQAEFADKLYVTRQAVQKWEVDSSTPDIDKIKDIAKMFNITIDDLLNDDIDELGLLNILNKDKIENKAVASSTNKRSLLDLLIFIPMALGIYLVIGIGYMILSMTLGLIMVLAIAGPIYGVYSLINAFMVDGSDIIISIAFTLLGLGMGYPLYYLSQIFYKKYIILIKWLTEKSKKIWKGVKECLKSF